MILLLEKYIYHVPLSPPSSTGPTWPQEVLKLQTSYWEGLFVSLLNWSWLDHRGPVSVYISHFSYLSKINSPYRKLFEGWGEEIFKEEGKVGTGVMFCESHILNLSFCVSGKNGESWVKLLILSYTSFFFPKHESGAHKVSVRVWFVRINGSYLYHPRGKNVLCSDTVFSSRRQSHWTVSPQSQPCGPSQSRWSEDLPLLRNPATP